VVINDVFRSRLHLHYSPDAFNSYGVVYENRHGTDTEQIGLQWNRLLKRRNTRFSQANLYLKSQVGHVQGGFERDALTAVGLAGDWETRRYFTSYDGRYVDGGKVFDGRLEHRARVGIAPYVAEYGSLHTWLMLQVEHRPESNNEVTITTLARFFHANYLVEVGITDNQDALFNWILRF